MKGRPALEHAVHDNGMKVRVQVETASETVLKHEQASFEAHESGRKTAATLERENLFRKDAGERTESGGVRGEQQPELERRAQHPLPEGHIGEHAIRDDEARVPHAPRVARKTDASALARETDHEVALARSTPGVYEAVRDDSTVEVGAELLLYVARKAALVFLPRGAQELVEVLADESVEIGSLWAAGSVTWRLLGEGVAEDGRAAERRRACAESPGHMGRCANAAPEGGAPANRCGRGVFLRSQRGGHAVAAMATAAMPIGGAQ
jgi:hypothetical protein